MLIEALPTQGLGAQEQGATEHIKVRVKNNQLGLGAAISNEVSAMGSRWVFQLILSWCVRVWGGDLSLCLPAALSTFSTILFPVAANSQAGSMALWGTEGRQGATEMFTSGQALCWQWVSIVAAAL